MTSSGRDLARMVEYEEPFRPKEHKIVYYDFRKKLPDVSPTARIGDSPEPRGSERSRRTIIAASPNASSKDQLIWMPAPKLELRQNLQIPDLVARLSTRLPEPPPPAKEPVTPPPKPPRAFVPPPAVERPKLPVPILDAPANDGVAKSSLTALPGLPALPSAPPPSIGLPAPAANPGNATVDIAVVNRRPGEDKRELPSGGRPAQFSEAPTLGPASSGATVGSNLTVPDLSIRSERTKPVPPPSISSSKSVLYADRVRSVPLSTLSVPLRPASRTVPRSVDARFQGRNVYTMVVPIENLPAYQGDWILWFAERDPKSGDTPVIRAPVPFRKLELVEQATSGDRAGQRIQLAAIVSKDGKLDGISVLTIAGSALQKAVIQDVASWEFRPATRNGQPIEIEIVLEIPFDLHIVLARLSSSP